MKKGTKLETLSWVEAETILKEGPLILIPLGAQLKEHGPHLPLNNDWIMANYLTEAILQALPVVSIPAINFSYYPAMIDYPGSVSLSESTAMQLIVEIVSSLSKFGPKNFYVINTGISTIKILENTKEYLTEHSINLAYSDLGKLLKEARASIEEQEGGSHADEIETSIMLEIAPHLVNIKKAVKDFHGDEIGPLRRDRNREGVYSPTGSWGDPTLASKTKGAILLNSLLNGITEDIQKIFDF